MLPRLLTFMILAATCGSVLIPVIYGASLKEGGSKTASALYQHLLGSRHRGPFLRESSGVQRRLDAPADQASDQQRRAAFRGNNKNNANANDDDQDVMWLLQRLETAAVQEREHEGGVTGIRQDDGVAPQPPLADSRSLLRFSSHHRKRHHPVLTTFTTARPATATTTATTAAATGTTSTPTAVSASRSTTASVPSRRTTATTTTTTTLTVETRSTARPTTTTTTTIATTMTSPRLPMQSTATTTEAVVASTTTTTTTTTAAAATTTRRARLTSRTRIRHRGKTDSAVRSGPVAFIDHLVESAMSSLKSQPQYHDAGRPSILMRTGLHFMDMNAQPRQPPVSNRTQVRHPSSAQTTSTTTTTTHTTEERQMRKARRRGRTRSISALPYEGHVRELRLKSHCSKAPLCVGARPHRVTASTDGCEPSHDTISIRALGVDRKLTIIAIKGAESNRTVCFSKKGKVISRTLKHRVPPLCQFLEEPSNDHRVRYRSRKHIGWYLSFDINGKPRSYCQGGERMCGRRREEHRTRNHRQCTKFSFMFPSRDALNGGDARLSPQQQIELLGKAHPNIPRQFPERSR